MITRGERFKNLPATAPSIIEGSLLAFWWHIKYQSPSRNLDLTMFVTRILAFYLFFLDPSSSGTQLVAHKYCTLLVLSTLIKGFPDLWDITNSCVVIILCVYMSRNHISEIAQHLPLVLRSSRCFQLKRRRSSTYLAFISRLCATRCLT